MTLPDMDPLVSIYLHGLDLDPAAVTAAIGVNPTKAGPRGEKIKSSAADGEITRKIGLWCITARSKSLSLSDHIAELRDLFGPAHPKLTNLPGVDSAYLDVYVSVDWLGETKTVTTELSAIDIEFICNLGLRLQYTTSVGQD